MKKHTKDTEHTPKDHRVPHSEYHKIPRKKVLSSDPITSLHKLTEDELAANAAYINKINIRELTSQTSDTDTLQAADLIKMIQQKPTVLPS